MTTKKDLIAIASSKAHEADTTIQCLLTAINEAYAAQNYHSAVLRTSIDIAENVIKKDKYYTTTDNNIVDSANSMALAVAKLQTLFFTLACALQAKGEKIEY